MTDISPTSRGVAIEAFTATDEQGSLSAIGANIKGKEYIAVMANGDESKRVSLSAALQSLITDIVRDIEQSDIL